MNDSSQPQQSCQAEIVESFAPFAKSPITEAIIRYFAEKVPGDFLEDDEWPGVLDTAYNYRYIEPSGCAAAELRDMHDVYIRRVTAPGTRRNRVQVVTAEDWCHYNLNGFKIAERKIGRHRKRVCQIPAEGLSEVAKAGRVVAVSIADLQLRVARKMRDKPEIAGAGAVPDPSRILGDLGI